uniref:Autophagy-related protein 9 n=2 Tax=Scheffersomyces stipitis (strain ATCC 58785 / CBS 6054 / NBRC 10063 / NRRL Y-11545) TaxID=322104 RepID=ATG9_PICST|nr:RecName: Full=Autophagy-related protein 9 [Scheffersomyces stipitis CBS 6054]
MSRNSPLQSGQRGPPNGSPYPDSSQNNDTFLSRIFGLNSVYNHLQENYQYYDPEFDSTYNQQVLANSQRQDYDLFGNGLDKTNLLDSESDSDLSSSSSASPSVVVKPRFKRTEASDNEDDEVDDLLTSLSKPRSSPPRRKPTFNIPNARDIFSANGNTQATSVLPLYNQKYRKPVERDTGASAGDSRGYANSGIRRTNGTRFVIPPKERALYLWANITNMDEFLTDLYYYYRGKGMLNIVLSSIIDLLILVFILGFTVFLKWGINYRYFFDNYKDSTYITLADLIIPNFLVDEVPLLAKFFLFGFVCYIVLRLIQLYFNYNYKLKEIKNFYKYLINISNDDELMTITWKTIVERLMLLKDYNSLTSTTSHFDGATDHYINDLNSKVRLNAHDIANRIMRKENYMIALINKDVLDLSLSPFQNSSFQLINNKSVLTKTLEWNLKLCINNFAFNNEGQINPSILKDFNRNQLAKELNSRFKMAAIINLILCPFIVIYFVLLYFFRYFNEYKSNPASIMGLRQYTPYAEWKLREFNELPHFFIRRLQLSVGPANTYINMFPRGFLVINLMNLVNFISGAIMAILVIMGLWFEDENHSFWSFELTEGKSTLFYISIFGTLWAITSTSTSTSDTADNLNPNSHSFVYDPEASLRYVSQFTHYLPSSWNRRLHTVEVKNEFCELYSLKIIIILNEIFSLILTPFILWFRASSSSGAIIDFFREYSIHVDGLGYVCYFAMFNFEEKDKNMMFDLNKRKGKSKRSRRSKTSKTSSKKTVNEIELNNIKSKRREKAKISDSEDASSLPNTSDDESGNDLNADTYQDEKMIKSYMYFLESYGAGKADVRAINSNNKLLAKNSVISNIDPSPSLIIQGPSDNHSLLDSAYNINYKFDDAEQEESTRPGKKSGVLGMINQFYKQDLGR